MMFYIFSSIHLAYAVSAYGTALSLASNFIDSSAVSHSESNHVNHESMQERGLPNAPFGYTPKLSSCPSEQPRIRSASRLSPNETSWLKLRRENTFDPMCEFLGRLNFDGFDAVGYIDDHMQNISDLPNMAIALSGGGYRALMNGGGVIQAMDNREVNATRPGHLGGLLQSATYIAGLSGGGWLTGSIYLNNFTTISSLLNGPNIGSVWKFERSILEGPENNGFGVLDRVQYFDEVYDAVKDKSVAGFETSITDYWGRALSYQLINASQGGIDYTWSSIKLADNFAMGQIPMPVLVADERAPGELLIGGNASVFEFSPWELGSFDNTNFAFAPLEFIGSEFSNGTIPSGECVRGFDNAGYVMGTSSSLFNQFALKLNETNEPDLGRGFLQTVLTGFGSDNNDIADYSPNPFFGFGNTISSRSRRLTLVDGGEDLQNIPLQPLIQPLRRVDVILAIDSSADVANWPNGTALVATYERSLLPIANGTAFPAIPDTNTFVNLGLNSRPTFFGCDAANTSAPTPLVVYIPNAPYVFNSNVSTFDLRYEPAVRNAIVQNGYAVATRGNGTVDPNWPVCIACAILSRSLDRTRTPVPRVCRDCFQTYCWDGTTNSSTPTPYNPPFLLQAIEPDTSGADRHSFALAILVSIVLSSMVALT